MSKPVFKTLPATCRIVGESPPARSRTQGSSPRHDLPPPAPMEPAPAPKAAKHKFQYQVASGLHTQQYPAYFRLVVEGPIEEKEAVEAVLEALKNS